MSSVTRRVTTAASPGSEKNLREYLSKHDIEPLLVRALKSSVDHDSADPAKHIADFMMQYAKQPKSTSVATLERALMDKTGGLWSIHKGQTINRLDSTR